ncbi:LacI family DNA-binding transcriptional regulator [Anaeromicropila herbilytica]|uniref:LacI family transcriptional regulator n=1 Tax=Anaeromicropila herbilytica TaxID=2785025 RepID=A0A7R7IE17_9FIRM|nr:LacI family DNA-binding transcriptional regulator [Anaeromicropila herbilytica]BCN30608.1 LacI family transcriptional regulator [Anaeromicropila herbilytica]
MDSLNIKDIAKLCGVGVSTVSRAINNHPDVNAETKAKIIKIIEQNNYIPNNSARNLKRNNSKTIAVLVKGITNPFFSPLIKTIEKEINQRNYSMLIHQIDSFSDEVDIAVELIKEKKLQGIIIVGGKFTHNTEKLCRINVPFVLTTSIAQNANLDSYSSISIDDYKESYKAVDYLCRLGHKKIAIITAKEDESIGKYRLNGYLNALKDHGIPINKNLIKYMHKDIDEYSLENGKICTYELLSSNEDFTAIFAISDNLAIGVCKAILDYGKSIPDDYSVLGFDGIELTSYFNPTITTIKQPVVEIGLESTKILFDLINQKCGTVHKIYDGELIVGGSCRSIL